jgi:hypothetical protein
MKRIISLSLLLISFCAGAQVTFSLRGGMNMSTITFPKAARMVPRFNAGTNLEFQFDDRWSLVTGPYYSGKGCIYGRTVLGGRPDSFTVHLNYIELPVKIAYTITENESKRLLSGAGPYIAYGFGGRQKAKGGSFEKVTFHRPTYEYKRLDFGYNIFLAYEVARNLDLQLDFSKSIINIVRDPYKEDPKERNQVISLSFLFRLTNRKQE